MSALPLLASRLFNVPLAIDPSKLAAVLAAVGPRFGLAAADAPPVIVQPQPAPIARSRAFAITPTGVAVLPIVGSLVQRAGAMDADSGLVSYAALLANIDAAIAAPGVRAIVLDLDSAGGEVAGLLAAADAVAAATRQKPVVAFVNEVALSAAYTLAASADSIVLPATGVVGSIGVLAVHVDQSEADAKAGRRYSLIHSGARKVDANPHEPLADEARATVQAEVDRTRILLAQAIGPRRRMKPEAILATEARLYFGPSAVSAGLADRVGTLADAVALAGALAERRRLAPPSSNRSRTMDTNSPDATAALPTPTDSTDPADLFASVPPGIASALRAEGHALAMQHVAEVLALAQLARANVQQVAEVIRLGLDGRAAATRFQGAAAAADAAMPAIIGAAPHPHFQPAAPGDAWANAFARLGMKLRPAGSR